MTRSTSAKDQTMALDVPNLDRLISYLEALPPEEFHMSYAWKSQHPCESACCIIGHVRFIDGNADYPWGFLDISRDEGMKITHPEGYFSDAHAVVKYPLSRAIRMLRHLRAEYLRTGSVVVDWGAPEAVEAPRKPWAPPVVIGADKPLPDALTSLLRDPAAASPIPQGERHGC